MEPTLRDTEYHTIKAPDQSEISRLIEELSIITGEVQDQALQLQERLRPVLRNEPAKDIAGSAEQSAQTDLGQFLTTVIDRLKSTNRTINDTRNKLEL